MSEAIEAARRILAANSPESFEAIYGDDHHYGEDCDLVATELLRLAEPEWGEPVADGWHWLEELDDDAPPQKVAKHSLGVDSEGRDIQPIWRHWTVAGWTDLKGRVAPCAGRPRKAGE